MSRPRDGGLAFPRPASVDPHFEARCASQTGMSLRDYFAGQALVGFLASEWYGVQAWHELAVNAYQHADAMLDARDGVEE